MSIEELEELITEYGSIYIENSGYEDLWFITIGKGAKYFIDATLEAAIYKALEYEYGETTNESNIFVDNTSIPYIDYAPPKIKILYEDEVDGIPEH